MATDEKFRNSVAAVATPQAAARARDPVKEQEKQKPVRSSAGVKVQTEQEQSNAGGAIAGPLTEVTGARVYQSTATTITATDGILTFKIKRLLQTKFKDANNEEVTVNYSP